MKKRNLTLATLVLTLALSNHALAVDGTIICDRTSTPPPPPTTATVVVPMAATEQASEQSTGESLYDAAITAIQIVVSLL